MGSEQYPDHFLNNWFVACASKDLKAKPLGRMVFDIPVVIARLNGVSRAFLDRCPHRNVYLSRGKLVNDALKCPYHGWEFDHEGLCVRVPGLVGPSKHKTRALEPIDCLEVDGFIWVSVGNGPITNAPPIPSGSWKGRRHTFFWCTQVQGDIANVIENFLDPTHTHFVHSGLIRRDKSRHCVTAVVRPKRNSVEVEYPDEGKQKGIISTFFERNRETSFGRYIYPSTAEIEYCSSDGTSILISAHFSPSKDDSVRIHATTIVRGGSIIGILKQAAIWPFFRLSLEQDRKIIDNQYENINCFGKEKFTSTELDLVGPHLRKLIKQGPIDKDARSHTVEINL